MLALRVSQRLGKDSDYRSFEGAFTLSGITHNSDGILAYSSSDTKVVTVDEFGLVSIVGGGMAKITVSMAETETYSAADSKIITIRVNAPFQIEVVNGTTTSDTETVYWDTTVTITADAPRQERHSTSGLLKTA